MSVKAEQAHQRLEQLSYYPQLIDRICELAGAGVGPAGIADHLEAERFRPAKGGRRITATTVRDLMRRLDCLAAASTGTAPLHPAGNPAPTSVDYPAPFHNVKAADVGLPVDHFDVDTEPAGQPAHLGSAGVGQPGNAAAPDQHHGLV